jgi:hypothetical protein
MRKTGLYAVLAAILVFAISLAAGAQGPPPRGDFGRRGPDGPGGPGGAGGPGGPMGGFGSCTAPCTPYQFTVTITSTEPVLVNGAASTIHNTTTGTIARDTNGSTYRDLKLSGFGPWAPQGGPEELIFIKNLEPSIMTDYIVNVTKGTYEQFAIHPHTPSAKWQGKGPGNDGGWKGTPTPTAVNYVVPGIGGYACAAERTIFSHPIQLPGSGGTTTITTDRVYCPTLKLVLQEDHSDPRFGTRTYQLSDYIASPSPQLFTPPFGDKLVESKKFSHGGRPRGSDKQPPPVPRD